MARLNDKVQSLSVIGTIGGHDRVIGTITRHDSVVKVRRIVVLCLPSAFEGVHWRLRTHMKRGRSWKGLEVSLLWHAWCWYLI
jgi:hypothetical protein